MKIRSSIIDPYFPDHRNWPLSNEASSHLGLRFSRGGTCGRIASGRGRRCLFSCSDVLPPGKCETERNARETRKLDRVKFRKAFWECCRVSLVTISQTITGCISAQVPTVANSKRSTETILRETSNHVEQKLTYITHGFYQVFLYLLWLCHLLKSEQKINK